MKNISLYFFFVLIISNQSALMASTLVYVMPEQYAYVAGKNAPESSYVDWGGKDKWDDIVLWGRCPDSYIGYQYKWIYGDGSETGWINIVAFDSMNPFNSSNLFLKSDSHQYDIKSSEIIQFSVAKLLIKNGGVIISTTTLNVKVVDMNKMTVANGYSNPEESKRLIVESIAKGRGLTWIYLKQNKSDGSWAGTYAGGSIFKDYPMVGTSLALTAFFNFGHSISDPEGKKDIFVDCVNNGLNYIFSNAQLLTATDSGHIHGILCSPGCTWGSDINNNGTMIGLTGTDYFIYQHGIAMLALAGSYNQQRAVSKVNIGSSPGVEMFYVDVISDIVDYASWAQNEVMSGSSDWSEGGWGYSPNYIRSDNSGYDMDLSVSQWPVLGLAAIEEVWGKDFKAPDFVRKRMLENVIRAFQYQDPASELNGSVNYEEHHATTTLFNDIATYIAPVSHGDQRRLTGTNSFLQMTYYISLDTTTNITACSCSDSNDCTYKSKDLKLTTDFSNSCDRVKGAIDYIARKWLAPPILSELGITTSNSYYTMYGIVKALRLYNYEKNGINDGILYRGGNNFGAKTGIKIQWEDQYSDFILKNQQSNGSWIDDCFGENTGYLSTTWALLILSEIIYLPSAIKTELLEKEIQRASTE